jgi:hypothetical protein
MASHPAKWSVHELAVYVCGAALTAILVLLWAPSLAIPGAQAAAAMLSGLVPLTWTLVALLVAAIGLILGWLVPGQPAAQAAVATLLLATCIVFWSSAPSEESSTSTDLAMIIGGSLLPPVMFGWLLGYGYRQRCIALEPPQES